MKHNKILSGLVFAMLMFGVFVGGVSATKKVEAYVYPFDSKLYTGIGTEEKIVVRITNTGDEALPKGTKLFAELYYGCSSSGKRLAHISKSGKDMEIKSQDMKSFSFKYPNKFSKPGDYCFELDVYNSDGLHYGKVMQITVKPKFSANGQGIWHMSIDKKEYSKVTVTNTGSKTFDNTVKLVLGKYVTTYLNGYHLVTRSKSLKGISPGETREILLPGDWTKAFVTEGGYQIAKIKD